MKVLPLALIASVATMLMASDVQSTSLRLLPAPHGHSAPYCDDPAAADEPECRIAENDGSTPGVDELEATPVPELWHNECGVHADPLHHCIIIPWPMTGAELQKEFFARHQIHSTKVIGLTFEEIAARTPTPPLGMFAKIAAFFRDGRTGNRTPVEWVQLKRSANHDNGERVGRSGPSESRSGNDGGNNDADNGNGNDSDSGDDGNGEAPGNDCAY